jgi:hypothetical protein
MKTVSSKSAAVKIKARMAFQNQLKKDFILIMGASLLISIAIVTVLAVVSSIIFN